LTHYSLVSIVTLFFFYSPASPLDLHSFPTRRSSDLVAEACPHALRAPAVRLGTAAVPTPSGKVRPHALPNTERIVAALRRLLDRSEEHTSELQSRGHLVCRLLLEKKNKTQKKTNITL